MEYIVSARKYRPMSFDSVVGQAALTTTLKNAVHNQKLAHAYLFCGPRGVGKTTCARIFAKAINCLHPTAEGEACGECESCQAFNEQRSFNIFELDAASNNSVENIKTLMEQTRIPPQVGKYKVFIIDEVHMLSTAAFNAFLKTLEEPPAHVIFVLATTEKHKILPTILSRCQIFDFERMTVENTINHLRMVADKEGITYDDRALSVIAEKADGGMRDALSIFDQAVSFCQGNLTYEKVIEDLNVLDSDNYFNIVDLSLQNKVSEVMLLLNNIIGKGFDAGNLALGLASHVRNVLMAKDPQTTGLLEVSDQQRQRLVDQAQRCPVNFLYHALKLLNQCDINYRQSSNKRLLVELTLIQVAQITQPADDVPGAGRSPKRLKSLFRKLVAAAQSQTAQQVAVTERPAATAPAATVQPATPVAPVTPSVAPVTTSVPNTSVAPSKPAMETVPKGMPNFKKGALGPSFGVGKNRTVAAVAVEEQKVENGSNKEFTQDDLSRQWLAMCNRMQLIQDLKGLASRMKNFTPSITEFPNVELIIDNDILEKQLLALKRRILLTLQKGLQNADITLEIKVVADDPKFKLVSKRDMLDRLCQSNSAVGELVKAFDLELS